MCFTPLISFLTFTIESALALCILSRNAKNPFNRTSAAILFLLGAYQFSEFALCTSGNALVWARIGHIAYTFLPALGVHWALILTKNRRKIWPIYILPAIFVILAATAKGFVNDAQCARYFIRIIYNWSHLWSLAYQLYYSIFILIFGIIFVISIKKEGSRKEKMTYFWGFIGAVSFTLPTFIFVLLLPSFNIYFPSILCHFALLFAIAVAYIAHLIGRK